MNNFTLLLLGLSEADSSLDAMVTTLVKFPMGLCSRLFHLVGVVLGDFPAAVVAMANKPGVEKSRHSMTTPMRLTRVSTKARSWEKKHNICMLKMKCSFVMRVGQRKNLSPQNQTHDLPDTGLGALTTEL